MDLLVEHIVAFVVSKGALGVFLAAVLEEIIVPIPSMIVQTGAGFLFLADQPLNAHALWILFTRISIPSAIGTTLGSLVIYGLVYWGGMPAVRRFGRYFFLSEAKVERAHNAVIGHKSLTWAFCVLRFIPILPSSLITAGAGLIRLPIRTYVLTTLVGIFIRATYLGIGGWLTGEAFHATMPEDSIFGMFTFFALGVLIITVISGILIGYVRRRKKKASI